MGTAKTLFLKAGFYYKIRELRRDTRLQREFAAGFLGKDDLVFDVGANIGDRAEVFSQLCRQVIAIEPDAECVRHLQSRFRWNPRVVIEPIGLSDREGAATLYESDNHYLSSFSRCFIETTRQTRFENHEWRQGRVVPTSTLDLMIGKYGLPAYVKIDVEGFEVNVLRGLNQAIKTISFEFTPELHCETQKCVQKLTQLSDRYLYNYYRNEDFRFALTEAVEAEEFLSDILPCLSQQERVGEVYAMLSY